MFDKKDKDFIARLNKASTKRRRRNGDYLKYGIIVAVVLVLAVAGVLIGRAVADRSAEEANVSGRSGPAAESGGGESIAPESIPESTESEEEIAARKELEEKQAVVDAYGNLGIVEVSGYLNVRKTPSTTGDIIGKLQQYSACEILATEGDWYQISSGGIEGYISNQFVLTGEAAREKAMENVKLRAIVGTEKLNIRQEPVLDASNVLEQALINERYEVLNQAEGWIQIPEGYISSDYAEVRFALNEARKLDLKAMALNQYDNLVISKVNNYLNIRKEPKEDGNNNVIGKFPSKAAGEILETLDGWYKIKSGNITGYVTADSKYTAIGQEAKDLALQSATLMAVVNTDKLNVRKEPSTDSSIWTQISKEDRYPVVQQLDGWVQIELDSGEEEADAAYISTRDNNVEVRYALTEAIKFSPLEEKANQESSLRNKIANYGVRFVGNPYVWGGTSLTRGADCSGFVQSVLKNFGISVPRTSREQAKVGKSVSSSKMRPGDLIFYANSSGTINHVAMYIGNGQIVHAASRRSGIKISTWNYRTPKYIKNVID